MSYGWAYYSFLKGPKHEIFGSGVFFPQIRPYSVLLGDLGTRPKNQNLGLTIAILYFLAY